MTFCIQVQAQFEVEAANEEDACDVAFHRALVMDPALWTTVILPCDDAGSEHIQ